MKDAELKIAVQEKQAQAFLTLRRAIRNAKKDPSLPFSIISTLEEGLSRDIERFIADNIEDEA